jgi:hypothetical protein
VEWLLRRGAVFGILDGAEEWVRYLRIEEDAEDGLAFVGKCGMVSGPAKNAWRGSGAARTHLPEGPARKITSVYDTNDT